LRREKERLSLEIDVEKLRQEYEALIAAASTKALRSGKLEAQTIELIEGA
jgi:hypothetical protein